MFHPLLPIRMVCHPLPSNCWAQDAAHVEVASACKGLKLHFTYLRGGSASSRLQRCAKFTRLVNLWRCAPSSVSPRLLGQLATSARRTRGHRLATTCTLVIIPTPLFPEVGFKQVWSDFEYNTYNSLQFSWQQGHGQQWAQPCVVEYQEGGPWTGPVLPPQLLSLQHKRVVWLVRQQFSSWLGFLRPGEQGGGRGQVAGGAEDGHYRRGGLVRASNSQDGLFRLFLDMLCS